MSITANALTPTLSEVRSSLAEVRERMEARAVEQDGDERLRERLEALESAILAFLPTEARVEVTSSAVSGLPDSTPSPASMRMTEWAGLHIRPPKNRTRQHLMEIVATDPEGLWPIDRLLREFQARQLLEGVQHPREALRQAALRLVSEGKLAKTAYSATWVQATSPLPFAPSTNTSREEAVQ
jgi:hypothetical protein